MKKINFSKQNIMDMSLKDVNKNIKIVGKQLAYRINRIYSSKPSIERNRALEFSSTILKTVVNNRSLSGAITTGDVNFKEFSDVHVARGALLNIQTVLLSDRSTIEGQKLISRHRRQATRETIKAYGIKRRFTNKELDILTEVFISLEASADYYESGEVIEEFNELSGKELSEYSPKEIADIIKSKLPDPNSVIPEINFDINF